MSLSPTHLQAVIDQDGAVILDIEHDAISTLNATGAFVWERLRQGRDVETIVGELALETGAARSDVDRDVRVFLGELKLKHLLPY